MTKNLTDLNGRVRGMVDLRHDAHGAGVARAAQRRGDTDRQRRAIGRDAGPAGGKADEGSDQQPERRTAQESIQKVRHVKPAR